ncbi:MAG: major capsid protein [Pseudomonadota bacterium]
MATIGNRWLDLADLYKMKDDWKQFAVIIELLHQHNPMLTDALTIECNQGTSHRTTVRTGLPSLTWGQLYKGTPQSKGSYTQVDDTTGFLEGSCQIDERLLKLGGNAAQTRMNEAEGFMEAFAQDMARQLIYGNVNTNPERFTGFAPRFNDLTAVNGRQIVDAGGTGSNNTSIWMVTWGANAAHMIYPQGTPAGLDREDKGSQRVLDAEGNPYYAQEEMFTWHAGLTVRNWQKIVRIANIDTAALAAGTVDIYKFLRQGYWRHQRQSTNKAGGQDTNFSAIYCNADVLEALDGAATPTVSTGANQIVRVNPSEQEGMPIFDYRGVPVRQTDALLNTEARVV